jgi:sugar phosphate isomerase/epimerase
MALPSGIAVSAPLFSLSTFEEMVEKVETRFAIWEMITEGNLRLPDIKDRLREAMGTTRLGFAVHAPISDVNIASVNPRMLDASMKELADTIAVAGELGISPVTIHIGYVSPLTILNKDKARETAYGSLRALDKVALEHGVPLAAENMPRTRWAIFTDPEELEKAIEGTEVKLCFDIGHAHISGNIEGFMGLADRFINVHIHDNEGKYDQHLVLGKGTCDLKGLVSRLEPGYKGNWVIECTDLEQGVESRDILGRWLDEV